MLHELRATRQSEQPSMTHTGPTNTVTLVNESSQIHTRSIRQLQEASRGTSEVDNFHHEDPVQVHEDSKEGEDSKSEIEDGAEGEGSPSKSEKGTEEGKNSPDVKSDQKAKEKNENGKSKEEAKKSETKAPGGRLTLVRRQEEEAKARELELKLQDDKDQYVVDMFGYGFDFEATNSNNSNLNTLNINAFKDDTMRALQEKSFQGLYLRLQFWINQIYKRLQSKVDGCNFRLYKTHIMVMKTIILFLSYMRDVVHELRLKGVNDYESYEWQKQIRLTWNASEPGCKVE